MFCGLCEGRVQRRRGRQAESSPAAVWGVERLQGLLCAACGALLGADDIAQRLLHKHSQLARFGLVGLGPPPPRPGPARLEGD